MPSEFEQEQIDHYNTQKRIHGVPTSMDSDGKPMRHNKRQEIVKEFLDDAEFRRKNELQEESWNGLSDYEYGEDEMTDVERARKLVEEANEPLLIDPRFEKNASDDAAAHYYANEEAYVEGAIKEAKDRGIDIVHELNTAEKTEAEPSSAEAYAQKLTAEVRQQLADYSETQGLPGLEGRIGRGLDPAGMMAVPELRSKLERVAQGLGVDFEAVEQLTRELHKGAIWSHADVLVQAPPVVQVWMVAALATLSGKAKKTQEFNQVQFAADYMRILGVLNQAEADPVGFAIRARASYVEESHNKISIEDGVPFAEEGDGFLAMAVNGYHAGVVGKPQDTEYAVGADRLNFEQVAAAHNLQKVEKEDRGRLKPFYVDAAGTDIIKQVYPGLGIILTGDRELAKELARTGQ